MPLEDCQRESRNHPRRRGREKEGNRLQGEDERRGLEGGNENLRTAEGLVEKFERKGKQISDVDETLRGFQVMKSEQNEVKVRQDGVQIF